MISTFNVSIARVRRPKRYRSSSRSNPKQIPCTTKSWTNLQTRSSMLIRISRVVDQAEQRATRTRNFAGAFAGRKWHISTKTVTEVMAEKRRKRWRAGMQTIRTLHETMSRGFWIAMTIAEVGVTIKHNYSEEVETDWNHEGVCIYGTQSPYRSTHGAHSAGLAFRHSPPRGWMAPGPRTGHNYPPTSYKRHRLIRGGSVWHTGVDAQHIRAAPL